MSVVAESGLSQFEVSGSRGWERAVVVAELERWALGWRRGLVGRAERVLADSRASAHERHRVVAGVGVLPGGLVVLQRLGVERGVG